MPNPNLGPPEVKVGGYIPFVDIPCERWIGEAIVWIVFLSSSSPTICSLIPWLCCPVPFDLLDPDTIDSNYICEDIRAEIGASIFWTMQGASIWGLILALTSLGKCTVEQLVGEVPDVVFEMSLQEGRPPLFDLSLDDPAAKSLANDILKIANSSLLAGKLASLKKDTKLNKKVSDVKSNVTTKSRKRRQTELKIPIMPQLYTGADEDTDLCERHEIMHVNGECCEILQQGPCEDDEFVIVDSTTKKGICVPRLCSPDRVFVFEDQRCHDPFEVDICPPGRQLTTSAFGTPVCICPDGTYEEEEDSEDEDVCQPILGKIESCSAGYVFWFDNFRSRPHCIPDPCAGINAKKGLNEMPYVPSTFDGKCYQIGQELPQCPEDTFYTLAFDRLKGICASLEDAGYLIADGDGENFFSRLYGPRVPTSTSSTSFSKPVRPSVTSKLSGKSKSKPIKRVTEEEEEAETTESEAPEAPEAPEERKVSKSAKKSAKAGRSMITSKKKTLSPETIAYLQRLSRFINGSKHKSQAKKVVKKEIRKSEQETENENEEEEEEQEDSHHRQKRDSLPYASPSFVFEPALASCRAGAIRGFNNKCRSRILPSRTPLSRPRRNVRVEPPVPICPKKSFYSIRRKCVSNSGQIQANLLAQGLG